MGSWTTEEPRFAIQIQMAVPVYLSHRHILPFGFADHRCSTLVYLLHLPPVQERRNDEWTLAVLTHSITPADPAFIPLPNWPRVREGRVTPHVIIIYWTTWLWKCSPATPTLKMRLTLGNYKSPVESKPTLSPQLSRLISWAVSPVAESMRGMNE